jgi:phosphohistidine phosphatase
MRLYLIRHAIAEETESRFLDPLRALTAKGRRRFRRSARAFAELDESITAIFTSPFVRAVQTAELLAAALQHEEVTVLDELRPDAAVEPLLRRLAELDVESAALIGHKRLLSELAAELAGVDDLRIKHGVISRLDVRDLTESSAKPRWRLSAAGTAPFV